MAPEQYCQWHTWWVFPLFRPIFWIVMIGLCFFFVFGRGGAKKPWEASRSPEGETALDILKKRYAKGEISQGEFEPMKRDIEG